MPSIASGLLLLFTPLVLGGVVEYTSVTTSSDQFVQHVTFENASTLATCTILAYADKRKDFIFDVNDQSCTTGFLDFSSQVSDGGEDLIRVQTTELSAIYAGMVLVDGNMWIILPNGRVCSPTALPANTADKVSHILPPLTYYKGFVYTCGGGLQKAKAFLRFDLRNFDLGWQPLAQTPEAVHYPGLITYNDNIFMWGGNWSQFGIGCQKEIYVYAIGTDSWSIATTFSDGLAGLENNEQIIHGKYAFLFGQTCAPHSDAYEVIHLYNMDSPGDPPVEMTHKLPIGIKLSTDCVKVTLSAKGLGILCAGQHADSLTLMKTVLFMPLNDDPDVDGWEPWEEMSPLKFPRSSVVLLNLGKQLFLAGGYNKQRGYGDGIFAWNNETLEFDDDQEIEPLPYDSDIVGSVTILFGFVREMCHDYL